MSRRAFTPLFLLLILVALAGCGKREHSIVIGHSVEEPGPSIAQAVSGLLNQNKLPASTTSFANEAEILQAVLDGTVVFAIAEEPERKIKDLATVVPLYPSILHVLHKKGMSADSLADLLDGKTVYAGPIGGPAWRLLDRLTTDLRVEQDYQILDNPWEIEPDVYFVLGGLLTADSLSQLSEYELFSFGDAANLGAGTEAEGIALRYNGIETFTLPAGLYGSFNPSPVLTISTQTVLIAKDDCEEELVRKVAKLLLENVQEVAAPFSLVTEQLKEDFNPHHLVLHLHPGSRRYLERDNPSFVERWADVIALIVTFCAAIASGFLALARFNRNRKKDTIDRFYREILELRSKVEDIASSEERTQLEACVKKAQADVFGLAIDERIESNASLVAFINLSNQVLCEVREICSKKGF
ncbi:TAXI family TRAP transporter solute-binding subunit [Pelagicoccus sp. SDUM812003]|uniref:TAXI family TRAP transporter solute-binding subunit n=1 Tax=Pelagicoccus sp. SDUM812003 TaxID=3041267 RepID=UPI00280D676C|nr:TAXI family TRAP transporter solute-binding subunit [Pelagicoccus sp. SDUM812003]MDQ8205285.1 TAXI family TRAP transporter solute-binding subunit [Pelagicoccus sp. SDUM812003]